MGDQLLGAHPQKMPVGSASISESSGATSLVGPSPSYPCQRPLASLRKSDQAALPASYLSCATFTSVHSEPKSGFQGGRRSTIVIARPRPEHSTLT